MAMDVEMDTSPSFFDPEDLSTREKFRRYGFESTISNLAHDTVVLGDLVLAG